MEIERNVGGRPRNEDFSPDVAMLKEIREISKTSARLRKFMDDQIQLVIESTSSTTPTEDRLTIIERLTKVYGELSRTLDIALKTVNSTKNSKVTEETITVDELIELQR